MAKEWTVGQLATAAVKQEVVQLLLWLVLPAEGLAVALSLLFCLWLCDSASKRTLVVALYDRTIVTTGQ